MTVRELLVMIGFRVDRSGANQADSTLGRLESRANSLGGAMGALGAALGMAFALREVFQMADAWASVQARVSLVTKNAEEQKFVIDSLYEIAQKTRQEFTTTADLYGKIARNANELKLTQTDILGLTEDVNKALIIGGGKTGENQAAVLQLGQALASGRLQGDEFRSLMENAPRLTNAIAKGMGVGIGQLRQMSKDGELTADKVIKAIRSQSEVLNNEFEKMPTTIGQAITKSANMIGKFLDDVEKETGVFKAIAKGIITFFTAIIDGTKKAAAAVGGFKNAVKLLILTLAGLRFALFVFAHPLSWLPRLIVMIRQLRTAVIATSQAFWSMLMNPLFWEAAAIAAGVALIALALEDIYYWVTGGESVIAKQLGTWEEFKTKVIAWVTELKDYILGGINAIIKGFNDFSSDLGKLWDNIKAYAISAFDGIIAKAKDLFSFLNPIINMVGKLKGTNFGVNMKTSANLGMAGAGARNNATNIIINQELPPGTPAQQASFVQGATKEAAGGLFNQKLVLGMQYS